MVSHLGRPGNPTPSAYVEVSTSEPKSLKIRGEPDKLTCQSPSLLRMATTGPPPDGDGHVAPFAISFRRTSDDDGAEVVGAVLAGGLEVEAGTAVRKRHRRRIAQRVVRPR